MQPYRAVLNLEDLEHFRASAAHEAIMTTVRVLCDASKDTLLSPPSPFPPAQPGTPLGNDACVGALLQLLAALHGLLDATPPHPQGSERAGSRFGNKAYQDWFDKMTAALPALVHTCVDTGLATNHPDPASLPATRADELCTELVGYARDSFGNRTRIDFGTGHEAAFVMFLTGLRVSSCLSDASMQELATSVVPVYVGFVHRLVGQYQLEPAGTHGAWSLDDYSMLPFVLGAAQLASQSQILPVHARNRVCVRENGSKYLYMQALDHVLTTKSSAPFSQASPMLHDMAALPSWELIASGLTTMFACEVLGKFPVAQHFVFGTLLPAPWRAAPNSGAEAPQPVSGLALVAIQSKIPRHDVDPFVRYFHHPRPPPGPAAPQQGGVPFPGFAAQPFAASLVATPPSALADEPQFTLIGDGDGIEIQDWVLASHKSHLAGRTELEAMEREGLDFNLPEMVFGRNSLQLKHVDSGVTIRFETVKALERCKLECNVEGRSEVSVPIADKWAKLSNEAEIKKIQLKHDWTYTTDYFGTFLRNEQPLVLEPTNTGINYTLLKRKDPILWYDDVTLFESELDDFGMSKLSVKVRVMAKCFFVLQRFWMRVDGALVRVWDTRVFHVFGKDEVVVELSRREMGFDDLVRVSKMRARHSYFNDPQNFAHLMPVVSEKNLVARLR